MEFLKRLAFALAALALVLLALAFQFAVYYSSGAVTPRDIEPIEKSLQKVEATLKETSGPNGMLSKLKDDNEKLQADLQLLSGTVANDSQLRQKALDDLNNVVLSLTALEKRVGHDHHDNQTAITESLLQLKVLRERLSPTSTSEKMMGAVLTQFGIFLAAFAKFVVLLAWPAVALAMFIYLLRSPAAPERVAALFRNFKSVELFSAKFEIGDKIKFSAEETFDSFRKQAKNNFDHWVQKKALEDKVRALLTNPDTGIIRKINDVRTTLNPAKGALGDYRCTIHVPDLLFAETFYQLLDYIPRQPGAETRGRTWSYRFGFIGKLWRSEKQSDIWGTVPTNPEDLINNWGMTREEAENAGKGRKSFLGVLLTRHSVPVGLFYMDAKGENEFGPDVDEALRKFITAECDRLEITKDLADIAEELRGQAALIRIYSPR